MRRFKSPRQAQLFLSVHGVVLNLFRLARHRLKSVHHRLLRAGSFATWEAVTVGCLCPTRADRAQLRPSHRKLTITLSTIWCLIVLYKAAPLLLDSGS